MNKIKNTIIEKFAFHKTGFRLLKVIHSIDRSAIPLAVIYSVLGAAFPYIGFILSAVIIDKLLEGQYQMALIIAGITVASNLVIGLINGRLEELLYCKQSYLFQVLSTLIRKKSMGMDYETMENAEVKEKISHTEYTAMLNGGLEEILKLYRKLLVAVLSALTAFIMVIILCFAAPQTDKGFISILAKPIVVLSAFVVLMAVIITGSMRVYSKYAAKEKKIFEGHADVETGLAYFDQRIVFNYSAGKVIRLFNMKDMIMESYRGFSKKMKLFFKDMINVEAGQGLSQMGVNSVYTVFAYAIVLIKVLAEAVTIGSLTKYVGAMVQFNTSVSSFITTNSEIRKRCAYMGTFLEFMDMKSTMHMGTIPVEKRLDNEYEIEFHDVSFSYPGTNIRVLDHVSCSLTMKDRMAVVGRNGAGKTTFIKLLCRLYEPTEGYITLNGIDIRKYDYNEYLKLFGVVFQDYSLFAFPVGENVGTAKDYDENQVWKCLKQSGVADRIEKMTEKLKTPLFKYDDNGVEMSGGESQKVAIARALYKDAPFVILDEPTAALDPISEQEIYERFDDMVKDKTSIYISHRMSSCRFCNDIIVFDKGRIVERGSHEKLLDKDGYYSKLWNAQAQYYTA